MQDFISVGSDEYYSYHDKHLAYYITVPYYHCSYEVGQGISISMQVLFIILDNVCAYSSVPLNWRWGLARPMNAIKVLVCPQGGG